MTNKIQLKRSISSGAVPTAGQLVNIGEVFVNTTDQKLYVSKGDGTAFILTPSTGGITDGDKGDIVVTGGVWNMQTDASNAFGASSNIDGFASNIDGYLNANFQTYMAVKDEGVNLGGISTLNFVGPGVSVSSILGDITISIPGSSVSLKSITVNVPSTNNGSEILISVIDASVVPTSQILIQHGSYLPTDQNDSAIEDITAILTTPKTGSFDLKIFTKAPIVGPFKFTYLLS